MDAYCVCQLLLHFSTHNLAVHLIHRCLLDDLLLLVSESHLLHALHNGIPLRLGELAASKGGTTGEDLVAANLNQRNGLALAGLETGGVAGRRVNVHAVREHAVEHECGVGLEEGEVRADLHRTVALVLHLEQDAPPANGQLDLLLQAHDGTCLLVCCELHRQREVVVGRDREEGAVQRQRHWSQSVAVQ
jgi:hypothetical protein